MSTYPMPYDPKTFTHELKERPKYTNELPYEPEKKGNNALTWILFVIIIIVAVGLFVWTFWWGGTKGDDNPPRKELTITGVDFKVLNSTSIGATWVSVGDKNDIVTLYVNPTGQTMRFDKDGNPLGSYSRSAAIDYTQTSAVVNGLQPKTSYDAVAVVTNTKISGSKVSHVETGITTNPPVDLNDKFFIHANGQPGHISYNGGGTTIPTNVFYCPDTCVSQSLFHQDKDGFICAISPGSQINDNTLCSDNSSVLYDPFMAGENDNLVDGSYVLSIKQKKDIPADKLSSAKWIYNIIENEWCLTDTGLTTVATKRCMSFNPNNSNIPSSEDNKYIYVSPSGSKWTNRSYQP